MSQDLEGKNSKTKTGNVIAFRAQSDTSLENALNVFPDECGKFLDLTPSLIEKMKGVFYGIAIDVSAIKTQSQLIQAGQYSLSNPPLHKLSIDFVMCEANRLKALMQLMCEVQYLRSRDLKGTPAQLRKKALRNLADGIPISRARWSKLIRLSNFDVVVNNVDQR